VEEVAWVELGEALSLGSAEVRTFREGPRFSSRQGGKSSGDVRWSGGRDTGREERNQWFGQLEGLLTAWLW
jgi:hypothetical protein